MDSDGVFSYDPPDNFTGVDSFSYLVTFPDGREVIREVTVTVNAVNDAPESIVPENQEVDEGSSLVFSAGNNNQLSVIDIDSGGDSDEIRAVLDVSNGTLGITNAGGASVDDKIPGRLTVSGTLAEVNEAIANVTYQANTGFSGTETLTLESGDGFLTDSNSLNITVNPNNAPTNLFALSVVPLGVDENAVLSLGDVIDLGDVDGNLASATLSVSNGTLLLSSAGLGDISGNGTSTVTITGTQDDINAASSLVYQGVSGYSGSDVVSLVFSDSVGASGQVASLIEINVVDVL